MSDLEQIFPCRIDIIEGKPFPMTFAEWCAKRVMTSAEYDRRKDAGEIDPMGCYVIYRD